jgi:hypothetical protein
MDFFAAFSMLLAVGFLALAFLRQRIADPAAYHRALFLFLMALVCYFGIPLLFMVGIYLGIITMPIGFVLAVLSFRDLCRSLIAHPANEAANGTQRPAEGGNAGGDPLLP